MPAYEYFSDEQLTHAAHQDDLGAWETLIRRHGQRLLAYLTRLCGDEALARELWVKLWSDLWARRGQQAESANAVLSAFAQATSAGLRATPKPSRSDSEDLAKAGDLSSLPARAARLRAALLAVPPRERAALCLCYLDSLNFVDAGRVLNASVPEAKELCADGYAQLSEALGPRFLEEGLP